MAGKLVVIAVFSALLAFALADPEPRCMGNKNVDINNATTATFGCSDYYWGGVYWIWTIRNAEYRSLDWRDFRLNNANYDAMTLVLPDGQNLGRIVGYPGEFLLPPGNAQVTFTANSGFSRSAPLGAIVMSLEPAPPITRVLSGQPNSVDFQSQGGMLYYTLGYETLGSQFRFHVQVYQYSGLKEPNLFVVRNRLPTLERYDWQNATVLTGGVYDGWITVNNPPTGQWNFGVFSYGSSTKMTVTAHWTFGVPVLQSGVKVSDTVTSTSPKIYQLQVGYTCPRLVFQATRQMPGGYVVVYLAQGRMPTPQYHEYVMDTHVQSYINLPINNPYGDRSSNPGNWLAAVYTTDPNAGFIMQADWA